MGRQHRHGFFFSLLGSVNPRAGGCLDHRRDRYRQCGGVCHPRRQFKRLDFVFCSRWARSVFVGSVFDFEGIEEEKGAVKTIRLVGLVLLYDKDCTGLDWICLDDVGNGMYDEPPIIGMIAETDFFSLHRRIGRLAESGK